LKNRPVTATIAGMLLAVSAKADLITTDPYFSDQWSLAKMNVPTAWGYSLGSSNVTIGVLDSGIIFATPDLQGRYLTPLTSAGATDSSALYPHGTWVASTIGMTINNGIGGAGAGNFSILPIRIVDSLGSSSDSRIIQGINLAAQNNCRVITISYSAASYSAINNAVASALAANQAAGRKDFLVFMAAGDSNSIRSLGDTNLDNAQSRLADDHLIMVAGTDQSDGHWASNSTFGSDTGPFIDIAAPAEHILVANGTDTTNPYPFAAGTSFAAPYAASAAALAFSINPDLSADQVQNLLFDTAFNPDNPHPGTPYWDQTYGWGRVDFAAVAAAAAATVPEPAGLALLGCGAALLLRRRRRA
jgi:hypothetical protein